MKLRGIEFGSVFGASGVQGFFGEGYRHHQILRLFGLSLRGVTFVAKTVTTKKRKGKMPLKNDGITPKEWFPRCVKVYFRQGAMLNAVGLSNPGITALLDTGQWQKRDRPFLLSFAPVEPTPKDRIAEVRQFKCQLLSRLPTLQTQVGLQIDCSCPNVDIEKDPNLLANEVKNWLAILSALKIPLMPKFSVLTPVQVAKKIADDPNCDAICVSNAIHWDDLDKVGIDCEELFSTNISPLAEFGGGGLSGKPLFPLVVDWLIRSRRIGTGKPILVGGGVSCSDDVNAIHYFGGSAIFIGSVVNLRWWRTRKIVARAHQLFSQCD